LFLPASSISTIDPHYSIGFGVRDSFRAIPSQSSTFCKRNNPFPQPQLRSDNTVYYYYYYYYY